MSDSAAPQPRVLAYNRVDENKRRARVLVALFALVCLPAAVFLALYLTFFFAVLVGMALGVLTAGGALAGDNWTAWAVVIVGLAVGLSLLTPVLIYRRAVYLILRLAGSRPLGEREHPELRRTIANLCIGAGLPQPRLFVVDARAPNAFSTGMSPESSSLVVTSGLLELLDRRELEGVLAHELAQIGNHDTRVGTILAAGVAFLRFPFTVVVGVMSFLFRVHQVVGVIALLYLGTLLISYPLALAACITLVDDDPAQGAIALATMLIPLYVLVIAPLSGEVLRAAFTRQRQFLADADAVLLARSAEPLAAALMKMQAASMAGLRAARSTAHLWTVDPLPEKPPWERLWPDYHPPVGERIALLAGMGSGISPATLEAASQAGRGFQPEPAIVPSLDGQGKWQQADPGPLPDSEEPSAYRLTADAVVYEAPDTGSAEIERLPAGALITVHEPAGEYLRVITPRDVFGYIRRLTPMVRHQVRA